MAFQNGAVWCASGKLYAHAAGYVGQYQARAGILPYRNILIHPHQYPHMGGVVRRQGKIQHVAHRDAGIEDRVTLGQPANRVIKPDPVIGPVGVGR